MCNLETLSSVGINLVHPKASKSLCIMPHRISIPLAASHIIFKCLRNFQHALDVLHAER